MNIIELSGHRYEVRNQDGNPQVKIGDNWINSDQFIDLLMDAREYKQVAELAVYGHQLIRKLSIED